MQFSMSAAVGASLGTRSIPVEAKIMSAENEGD